MATADERLWQAIGRTPYVALTTYRRSGAGVTTPVWIAPTPEGLVVTTGAASGKVKRIRNDARVALQPCGRFGDVAAGAPEVAAVAAVLGPAEDHPEATGVLRRKYGLQYALITVAERLASRRRGVAPERVILRLVPDEGDAVRPG